MSIAPLLVTVFLEALSPGAGTLACTFPAASPRQRPISVSVEVRPSLMDRIDRFRVSLRLAGDRAVGGLAQPIDRTRDRDVLISAQGADKTFYTIGLRDDGLAALNLLRTRRPHEDGRTETRSGACQGFQPVLDTWLRS